MKTSVIQLVNKTESGLDPFGVPTTTEELEDVSGVLVGKPTTDDITTSTNLYGKRLEYILGIPKGDTHDWIDRDVIIWGNRYHTFGFPETGEPENIPLKWGQNVKVERYE